MYPGTQVLVVGNGDVSKGIHDDVWGVEPEWVDTENTETLATSLVVEL